VNRLSALALGYVLPNQFLRWVEVNNMLILPFASVTAMYLLKRHLVYDSPARSTRSYAAISLIFVLGVYLLGASYGLHEITNYLHIRYCLAMPAEVANDVCRILIFNDDEFSHWLFFTAFIVVNACLMSVNVRFPVRIRLTGWDLCLVVANALFIGLGVFANLAFEEIGIDLYVVALMAIWALVLLWRHSREPMLVYYAVAYTFGFLATATVKVWF
jgi:hypothetical protein